MSQVYLRNPQAVLPTCEPGSQGFDLYAPLDMAPVTVSTIYESKWPTVIDTGVVVIPDPGLYLLVLSKSGLAANFGLRVVNSPGLIDATYVGEDDTLKVILESRLPYFVRPGTKIAQFVFQRIVESSLNHVLVHPGGKNRGGLGSTGV